MSKFDDDTREDLQNAFAYLEVPDENDFAAFIQAIADGIEYHEHLQTGGPGSGTGDASLLTPELGPGGTISDEAVDNMDTWKKLLASHPYLAAEAAPLMWEGKAAQRQAWSIATDGEFVYVGTLERPAIVVKIDPATMQTVSFWRAEEDENFARALLCHGGYLYVGLDYFEPKVIKINPDTMQPVTSTPTVTTNGAVYALITDGTHIYAGTHAYEARVYKINPDTMQTEAIWSGTTNFRYCTSLMHFRGTLWAGMDMYPAKIAIIDPATMTYQEYWQATGLLRYITSLTGHGNYAYVGLSFSKWTVIKLDCDTGVDVDHYIHPNTYHTCRDLLYLPKFRPN